MRLLNSMALGRPVNKQQNIYCFLNSMLNKAKLSIPNDTYFTIVADKVDSVSGIYCGATEVTLFEPHGEKCVKSLRSVRKRKLRAEKQLPFHFWIRSSLPLNSTLACATGPNPIQVSALVMLGNS